MPKPTDREKLVDAIHESVRAFVEGNGGKTWIVGPIRVDVHKATSYSVIVECVGEPPKWRAEDKT
jgi:hypothetical protein